MFVLLRPKENMVLSNGYLLLSFLNFILFFISSLHILIAIMFYLVRALKKNF